MIGSEAEVEARAQAMVGEVLRGKYRLERLLGTGGMASVFEASHRNGRRVAVKLLHPELAQNADVRERFVREGHAANAVDHPGVVAIIDDDVTEEGSPFLVMELLAGHTVEQLWEASGQRLPAETVLGIARDLCDALAAAHRRGVIHRDLKPANLFLTEGGELKILDFGIASFRAAAARATATGSIFGTPAFLPPEQAMGQTSQIDERSDLWAVGATMFTLLTGRIVHEGETGQHIAILAATQPAPSLASVLPGARPELVALVDRALARDKDARWPNAEAMREAIEAVQAHASPVCPLTATIPMTPAPRFALPSSFATTAAPVVAVSVVEPAPRKKRALEGLIPFSIGVMAILLALPIFLHVRRADDAPRFDAPSTVGASVVEAPAEAPVVEAPSEPVELPAPVVTAPPAFSTTAPAKAVRPRPVVKKVSRACANPYDCL